MSFRNHMTLAFVVAIVACALPAQNKGGVQPKPTPPPSHAPGGPSKAPEPQGAQAHNRNVEWGRRCAEDPQFAQKWQTASRDMLRHEHTYRMQLAKLRRIQRIYQEEGRMERVEYLEQLRTRLAERYQNEMRECRQALGDADFKQLQNRISQSDQLRMRNQNRTATPSATGDGGTQ